MKRILFPSLLAILVLNACNKNELNEGNAFFKQKAPENALVRFVHAYTSLTPTLATPPNGPVVDFYINNVKMNATAMSYTNVYPTVTGGGAFADAPSGMVNIKAVLNRPTGGGLPSDTIANNNFQLAPGVSHSIVLLDTTPNPTPYNPNLMVHQEAVSMAPYGKAKLRFMNTIRTTEQYELYNSTNGTVLTGPIAYKNYSEWIEVPSGVSSVYQLRLVGTTTSIASVTLSPTNLRSYTFWARGTNPTLPTGTGVTSRARSMVALITQ